MRRGDIYEARLDPVEGSEQSGTRPVLIVSRDALNDSTSRVIAVAITTFRGRPLFPNHVFLPAGAGGLSRDSVVLCEQIRVLAKARLLRLRGTLSGGQMAEVEDALAVALDLRLAP